MARGLTACIGAGLALLPLALPAMAQEVVQALPDPAAQELTDALQRLGRNPVDCWAFEDSAAGIEAAVAAGCQVYALLPSDAFDQATPAGVSRLISLRDVRW